MRGLLIVFVITCSAALGAQNTGKPSSAPAPAPVSGSKASAPAAPNLTPPRSDSVSADSLPDGGQSSSKETQIDFSPPPDDAKAHPNSSEILMDESVPGNGDTGEFHPWDPHRAAKDIEVGDFYFKRKNYRAAEDRYREALHYKDNDAVATYRLGVCLEKMDRSEEARTEYENYLKILPHGPLADDARKSIDRLKNPAANAKPSR